MSLKHGNSLSLNLEISAWFLEFCAHGTVTLAQLLDMIQIDQDNKRMAESH